MPQSSLSDMRRAAGYATQESLATALGVTRTQITKWETGARYPRPRVIPDIARALRTTEGEIIAAITAAREESA